MFIIVIINKELTNIGHEPYIKQSLNIQKVFMGLKLLDNFFFKSTFIVLIKKTQCL